MKYFILLIFSLLIISQEQPRSNPIMPIGDGFNRDQIRIMLGIGQNVQNDEFIEPIDICDCYFDGGVGTGFTLAIDYEREITRTIYWGAGARLENYSFESKFLEFRVTDATPISVPDGQEIEPIQIPVQFEQIATFEMNSIGFNPYIRFIPFNGFMFRTGLNFAYIYSNNFKHDEILVNNIVGDGRYFVTASNNGEENPTIFDGEIPEVNSFLIYVNFAISFPLLLPNNYSLAPGFEYSIPVNGSFSNTGNSTVSLWRLFFEFKIPLTAPPAKKIEKPLF